MSFRLSAAAYSRLEDLKSVSKASLSYAIEHHKVCLSFVTTIVTVRDELVTTNNHFQLLNITITKLSNLIGYQLP